MNGDARFEREARAWLDSGPTSAPERAIEAAVLEAESTPQSRPLVPWRLHAMSVPARLAAVAAAVALAVLAGTAILKPPPGPAGASPTPGATAAASPSDAASPAADVTVAAYKFERDAICTDARSMAATYKPRVDRLLAADATAAERTDAIAAFQDYLVRMVSVLDQLEGLATPEFLALDNAADVARRRDIVLLNANTIRLVQEGDLDGARAVDHAIGDIRIDMTPWINQYNLLDCP